MSLNETEPFDPTTNFGLWSLAKLTHVITLLRSQGIRFYYTSDRETEERLRAWCAWDPSADDPFTGYNLWIHHDDLESLGTKIVDRFPERGSFPDAMLLKGVLASLPNGLHDAELKRIEMDYVNRRLAFDLLVWIGNIDDPRRREVYRPARLAAQDVGFLAIEPPDANYPWLTPGSVTIDAGEGPPGNHSGNLPPTPDGTAMVWVYLRQMNRFLVFSARTASLEWTGDEENHA
jgi:hypothetical protein